MTLVLGLRLETAAVAWLWPGVIIALIVSYVLRGVVARRLRVPDRTAWLLLVSAGVILVTTLTPTREALRYGVVGTGSCDLSRIGLAPLGSYISLNDTSLNVVLFGPLGVAIGLLARSPYRFPILLGATILPFAIEATQLVLTPLGRGCESADVFDNLLGLFLGLAVGVTITLLRRLVRTS